MHINYIIVAVVVLIALAIIIFTIKKNNKDEKNLEETIYDEEVTPNKHDDLNAG